MGSSSVSGVKSISKIVRRAKALATKLDGNAEMRAAITARIVKAAEKAPVVLLHQVAMMLEMNSAGRD